MSRSLSTARFAAILAVAAIIFSAGLVSGAAGDPLILGAGNSSGASGTVVSTTVNGNGFAVAQSGAGASANGLRGDANTGTGGVFTSSSNNALFATAASGNRYAMVAVSGGGAGTGGGLLAIGNANPGVTVDVDSNSVPPLEVNSTGLVSNLNTDLLDSFSANGLTRLAFNSDDNDALAGVNGTAISTTITAPTRGWLHISASSDNFASAVGAINCNLDVDGTNLAASFRTMAFDGGSNTEEDCSTNAVFFTCGGTHTVALEGGAMNAGDVFDETTIEVEFHPFNGAGNRPSLIPCVIIPLDVDPDFTEMNN
jgi:hypothetical protein